MNKQTLTQARLKEALRYDLSSGLFVRLKPNFGANAIAGSKTAQGYLHIRIDRKSYKAHRLAFLYVLGWMPEAVDHINHTEDDNRWINLRPANCKINSKNKRFYINNTSGHTGVIWNKLQQKWRARITVDKKLLHLGSFLKIEDAIAAREAANVKYGFHENHGTRGEGL